MSLHDTIIVGAGIAGMTAALQLKSQGQNVILLEKKASPGGNIMTLKGEDYLLETGPHSIMGSSEFVWELVEALKIEDKTEPASPASKNRYIYRHEKLKALPMGFVSFITSTLFSPLGKFRLMLEPFIPNGAKKDDTAWDFFCRRFGKEAATYIMTPFVSGVYAGDVRMLGARAAFSKFWNFEKDSGSMIMGSFKYMKAKRKRYRMEGKKIRKGLFSFKGGLGTITSELAEKLKSSIITGAEITDVSRKNNRYLIIGDNGKQWEAASVIFATPPNETAILIKKILPELTELFNKIPMSPVVMVHWRVKDTNHKLPDGFGVLMPRNSDLRLLGTLFPSKLFKGRSEKDLELFSSFYGGMTDPDAYKLNDNELKELLFKEHKRIFKNELIGAEILKIIRYPFGIPQLLPDHPEIIVSIKNRLKEKMPGIFLAGNYLTGVGIENAVESGFSASSQVLENSENITGKK